MIGSTAFAVHRRCVNERAGTAFPGALERYTTALSAEELDWS
jgi:hypothetical protein